MSSLSFAAREKIRGMLADKQSAKTIAQEYDVEEDDILSLAKPKAVSVSCTLARFLLCNTVEFVYFNSLSPNHIAGTELIHVLLA